jgi:hypothetical protein
VSIRCIIEVFTNSQSAGNDRLVLLAIADEADDEGRNAFPSIRRLASKANCHPDTVIECIKRLEGLGELNVVRPEKQGRGRFNKYKVLLPGLNLGDSDLSSPGFVEGSVEGLVRTQSGQSSTRSGSKQANVRPFPGPVDKWGRRPLCEECEGWLDGAGPKELLCRCAS